jgi:hypothetical protein
MLELRGLRTFSLSTGRDADGISCDARGAFVGNVPLLKRAHISGASSQWVVRPVAELNDELTARYRLPIDVTLKVGALAFIANAFNRGDLAIAAIATVQMQFPDPPSLAKGVESADDTTRRALELYRSRLLNANWDSAKHPRAGAPPNPGWFAPVQGGSEAPLRVSGNDIPGRILQPLETGGGGGGGFAPASEFQPTLPFAGGLPLKLAPYVPGGKTSGIFRGPNGPAIGLESGYDGPAASIPQGSAGFDAYTLSHVEGHAAALMRQQGITEGTLFINNPEICVSCTKLLPEMLPPGASLRVVLPDGTVREFRGVGP